MRLSCYVKWRYGKSAGGWSALYVSSDETRAQQQLLASRDGASAPQLFNVVKRYVSSWLNWKSVWRESATSLVAVVLNYATISRQNAQDVNLFLRVSEFAASRYKRYYVMIYPRSCISSSRRRVVVEENEAAMSAPAELSCVRTTDSASRSKEGDEILTGSFGRVVPLFPR